MSIHILDENDTIVEKKSIRFFEAIDRLTNTLNKSDNQLVSTKSVCSIDMEKLYNIDKYENEIMEMEKKMLMLENSIEQTLHKLKKIIINKIFGESFSINEDFNIHTWILYRPEPLHPIAVRLFLYQLNELLYKKIFQLKTNNTSLKKSIDSYSKDSKIFDLLDYIQSIKKQSRVGKIFNLN